MKLNKFFSKNKLKPGLIFSQKGNIWRMHFYGDILVCETRDLSSKEVYFASLNYKTNEVYLKNFQLDEKWWVSVDDIDDSTIFFNYFKTPELPEHKGITTVELKTGKVLWRDSDLAFWFSTKSDVYAVKEMFEKKSFFRLNINNGDIVEEYDDEDTEEYLMGIRNAYDSERYANLLNTDVYSDNVDVLENEISTYFSNYFQNVNILGGIEYIRFDDLLIYNYHRDIGVDLKDLNRRNIRNVLEIYDLNKNSIIYSEVLNELAANYVPDSFFVNDGYLFFVKEKKELTIINLREAVR